MGELSESQKERVEKYLKKYLDPSAKKWKEDGRKEREGKTELLQALLVPEKLSDLSRSTVFKIIKNLWASRIWQNKEYKVDQIISENGLEKIGTELEHLLYGKAPLHKRFDRFQSSIKHLGPSSITEIMCSVSPERFCIWNDKPINILPFLKMKSFLPDRVYKYAITGKEYEQCIDVLDLIREELKEAGIEDPDFLDVDYFLYYIFDQHFERIPSEREEEKEELTIPETEWDPDKLSHWEAIGLITEIGNWLGYDTYVADPGRNFKDSILGNIATLKEIPPFTQLKDLEAIKEIDAIWFENQFPRCCFEVEHTTDISKGLLRIYQARNFRVKPFIIAPEENHSKYEREVNKEPFRQIKDEYQFRTYRQLIVFHEQAKRYHDVKERFL